MTTTKLGAAAEPRPRTEKGQFKAPMALLAPRARTSKAVKSNSGKNELFLPELGTTPPDADIDVLCDPTQRFRCLSVQTVPLSLRCPKDESPGVSVIDAQSDEAPPDFGG
jgi:hypothetical protein